MKRLIKKTAHEARKEALRAKLALQVLAVAVEDNDAESVTQLQQDDELNKLTNWIKG